MTRRQGPASGDPQRTPRGALLAALAAALAAGLAAAALLPLPWLFPWSDAAIWGGLTAVLGLGLVMMLPDRHLHSPKARLTHAFRQRHGVSEGRAELALDACAELHARADRLRLAGEALRPGAATEAEALAARLDRLARTIFYEPDRLGSVQPVAARSELVVEAAEGAAALVRTSPDGPERARAEEDLAAAMHALDHALEAIDRRAASSAADAVAIASETAETLLAPPSRRPRGDPR